MRLGMAKKLVAGYLVVSIVSNAQSYIRSPLKEPGMAMRLAFDLALHLDMSHCVSRGDITSANAELRRTVFWGAYIVDQ